MAKDKYMEGRNDGFALAYNIYKKYGPEEFEKEAKFRMGTGINVPVRTAELLKVREEAREQMAFVTAIVALMSIRDEFGFGKERLKKFVRAYNRKVGCLDPGHDWTVTIEDYRKVILEETGIDVYEKY